MRSGVQGSGCRVVRMEGLWYRVRVQDLEWKVWDAGSGLQDKRCKVHGAQYKVAGVTGT